MSSTSQIEMMALIQQVMEGMLRVPFDTLEDCEHEEVVEDVWHRDVIRVFRALGPSVP